MNQTTGALEEPIEELLLAFERDWLSGQTPSIESRLAFLAVQEQPRALARVGLRLVELDIEYRWRSAESLLVGSTPPRPRVEHYLELHHALGRADDDVIELVAAEYRARRLWGDRPGHAEYQARFPGIAGALGDHLERVDREITLETRNGPERPARVPAPMPAPFLDELRDSGPPVIEGLQYHQILGRGGAGVVYKAFDGIMGRVVAVKTTPLDLAISEDERGRFQGEARAAARINHPNIITVYRVGESRGRPFLVIEYLEGGTLADRLKGGPMPTREAALLIQTLATAIEEAHGQGVIHRDLKPSNILFTLDGRAKIGDFGLAKRVDGESARTATGAILGTPSYMAPEQAIGQSRAVGPMADVHALGAILYHMLTGRPPYVGDTPLETVRLVAETEPPPPRRIRPELARDLETICLKCLEKSPARRYSTARELADELGRFLAGKPVHTRRLGPISRFAKWTRAHPWQSITAASIVIAVAVVVALVTRYNKALRAEILQTQSKAAEARANYRQARQALRAMIDQSNAAGGTGIPKLLELRHAILQQALDFHDAILARTDLGDPLVLADTAAMLSDSVAFLVKLGRTDEAREFGRRALALLEKIDRTHPDNQDHIRVWTQCLAQLASIHRPNDSPETLAQAVEYGRKGVALSEIILAESPDDPDTIQFAAMARHDLGVALGWANQAEEAIRVYNQAVQLLTAPNPRRRPDWSFRAVVSLSNLGGLERELRRFDQAEKTLRRAWRLTHETSLGDREADRVFLHRGQVAVNLTSLLSNIPGKAPDMIEIAGECLPELEAYLKREPNDFVTRDVCKSLHGNRALGLSEVGRRPEAIQELTRAVELAGPNESLRPRVLLALTCLTAGDRAMAERVADQITLEAGAAPVDAYNVACAMALIAARIRDDSRLSPADRAHRSQLRVAQALTWLGHARELGFLREPANRAALSADTDLAILRDRPEFQSLVAEPAAGK